MAERNTKSSRRGRLAHGTISGYQDHRCRCARCLDVWSMYIQEYRETIFDDTKAIKKEVNVKLPPIDYAEYKVDDNS